MHIRFAIYTVHTKFKDFQLLSYTFTGVLKFNFFSRVFSKGCELIN